MTTFLNRSAWTSTAAGGAILTGTKLRGVAVHWPGSTQDIIGDPGQAAIASRLRSYRDYHVNSRGWSDIGYNFAIDQAGRVWMLRSTMWRGNLVGAHCASAGNPDANHEYVGVLLVLGDREPPSAAMQAAFRDWYRNRFLPGWPGRTDVRGHGRVAGAQTSCPGPFALADIAEGDFTRPSTPTPTPTPPEDWFDMATQADLENALRNVLAEQRITLDWDGGVPRKVSFYEALAYIHFNAADGSFVGKVPDTSTRTSHRGRATFATTVLDNIVADVPVEETPPTP